MLYFDKEKSRYFEGNPGVQFPDGLENIDFKDNITRFKRKIKSDPATKSAENVGVQIDTATESAAPKKFSAMERDAEYMKTVENGDMAKAQRMVDAVADKGMLREAYMAGAADSAAEIAEAIKGRNKLSGKRGLILGEDVKATDAQMALADFLGKSGGVQIRLVNKLEVTNDKGEVVGSANGKIQDGMITIALDADTFTGAVIHEMVHHIRKVNPAGYDAMRKLVFETANKIGVNMDKVTADYESTYRAAYGDKTSMMDIMEEVTADGFQKILNDKNAYKEFITELQKADKGLVAKIKEFLDKLMKTIESLLTDNRYTSFADALGEDLESVKKLRKMFAEVLAETGKMEEGAEGTAADAKYSKKLGGYFPEINISTNVVGEMGIKNINYVKDVIEKVCDKIRPTFLSEGNFEKPIVNIDTGMEVCVYKKGINETFGNKEAYEKLSDEWKMIKIAVASELSKIIKYGEVREKEAANSYNANSDTRYAYLRAPVIVDGREVIVDIDIRRTNRGDRFYMHKIKIADSSPKAAVKRPKSKAELSAEKSVAQKGRNSNSDVKFSFAGERAKEANGEMLATAKRMEQEAQLVGRGVNYCAACDGMFYKGKTVAVAGGAVASHYIDEYLAEQKQ